MLRRCFRWTRDEVASVAEQGQAWEFEVPAESRVQRMAEGALTNLLAHALAVRSQALLAAGVQCVFLRGGEAGLQAVYELSLVRGQPLFQDRGVGPAGLEVMSSSLHGRDGQAGRRARRLRPVGGGTTETVRLLDKPLPEGWPRLAAASLRTAAGHGLEIAAEFGLDLVAAVGQ